MSDASDLSDYYPRQRRRRHRPFIDPRIPLVVAAILAGWLGWKVARAHSQHRLVEKIREVGGQVVYDSSFHEGKYSPGAGPSHPTWVDRLCGADFSHHVVMVSLNGPGVDDDTLKLVGGLKEIRTLNLVKTNVTDAGLAHLKKLSDLRELDLSQSQVRDDGLAHLRNHPQLETLRLCLTRVGDAGLLHLKRLGQLRELSLFGTKVSGAAVKGLRRLHPELNVSW